MELDTAQDVQDNVRSLQSRHDCWVERTDRPVGKEDSAVYTATVPD